MHLVTAGDLNAPLVLLLHGFPEYWGGWRYQIDPLIQAGYRVIIPDQRGYHLSDKPRELHEYTIAKLIGDVEGLITWAGTEQAIVIGHDWGALVAWWLALLKPERVRKLAILNVPHPYVFAKTAKTDLRQMLKSWYALFFQIPNLPEWMISLGRAQFFANTLKMTANPDTFSDADIEAYRQVWLQPDAIRSMLMWYRAYAQLPPKFPKDKRIKVPVRMIWGVKDIALIEELAQPSIDLCDQGELFKLQDATHWVQHDQPEQVNQLLLEFLAR
ncbi:MAG: alpha/beta hydrolase [Anaerolineae bacterium]|nr:alpha/beta hydrolase [Anaerolineae bacterium]